MRATIMLSLLIVGTTYSCVQKSEYHRLVTSEMAKGERQDSLFLGIYLGMSQKDFYTHCWELNKNGVFRQGTTNNTVSYTLDDQELKHPGHLDFYPNFDEDGIIKEMPTYFVYDGWAPWNKHLSSDSLELDVINFLEKKYGGNPFIKVEVPNKGYLNVKVDGNRRIILTKEENKVRAMYSDLMAD
jgi:hypothetical protein